jgi:hypothetical protein
MRKHAITFCSLSLSLTCEQRERERERYIKREGGDKEREKKRGE